MPSFLTQSFGAKPNFSNVTNPTYNRYGNFGSPYTQLSKIYPQLGQDISQTGNTITSELAGQIPQDIQNNIKDYGAQWGLSTGMPGSGSSNDLTLADLGLTSLGIQQQGMQNYASFVPTLQSMFTLNPEQTAAIDTGQAAPNPAMVGLTDQITSLLGTIGGKASSLGSMGGGGMGMI